MAAVRWRDTKPELSLRQALHSRGLRYRVNMRLDLPGIRVRPDIVFTRRKLAVFVDGCFWHGCPLHATQPKDNARFWAAKLSRNVARDREQNSALLAAGWTVLRFWEHESPQTAADRVMASYRSLMQ